MRAARAREAHSGRHGVAPDQGTTSGSQSHPVNFNDGGLALAGATAREALLQMASQRMGVPATLLRVDDGVISGAGRGSLTYAELIGGRKFNLTLNPNAKRKPASEWTILGKPSRGSTSPPSSTGQFEFVHNVRVPGMLHGRVVRPPEVGATLVSVDESSVRAMPGFVKVVVKKNFVGVVAEKPWQATQIAGRAESGLDEGRRPAESGDLLPATCGTRRRRATASSSIRRTSTTRSRRPPG